MPSALLDLCPIAHRKEQEFSLMRYTAVTCQPDDFMVSVMTCWPQGASNRFPVPHPGRAIYSEAKATVRAHQEDRNLHRDHDVQCEQKIRLSYGSALPI